MIVLRLNNTGLNNTIPQVRKKLLSLRRKSKNLKGAGKIAAKAAKSAKAGNPRSTSVSLNSALIEP